MKFGAVLILSLIFSCYSVNSLPSLPSIPSPFQLAERSKEFVWDKLNTALVLVESVHSLVQNPPSDINEAKTMATNAMVDMAYTSTEKMLGPLFPLFILLNLSLKLQVGRAYNALNDTENFVKSLKYVTPQDIEREGIRGLYMKSVEQVRKRTLDPTMNIVQKNTVGPVESAVQGIKSKIPEFCQMDSDEYAYWKEFEAALTKDFKHYIAYQFLEETQKSKAKSNDINEKSKLLTFKENLMDVVEFVKQMNRPVPPKLCPHCGHTLD